MPNKEYRNIKPWGNYKLISLSNNQGTTVEISDLGATVVNFYVNDSNGIKTNIVLGYENPSDYIRGKSYLGCVVGPWANRIARGKFLLDGHIIQLETNEGTNHLHGGKANIGAKCWEVIHTSSDSVKLSCSTLEGEAGYPCDIDFHVEYQLSNSNELSITYSALPYGRTPINMTQHTYFNLDDSDTIEGHSIKIDSEHYLHVDANAIPNQINSVQSTPFDLRRPTLIREKIDSDNQQLLAAGGFDHCWALDGNIISRAASVASNKSGLRLDVYTDQIGIQFYSGNFLNGEKGRLGRTYKERAGLCLETQCYPNQVNMKYSEACIFSDSNKYQHKVIYKVTAD
ncbi:aldose epimerase family protein [Vibrio hippocampi]|uniref:Aldose 1-epimerase n=1 Tax=Vibrio hippocampi TaxID=654686 RepID=A0ABM8ZKS4_9VIBR|nr:aldose epimerase family protein [Vibrio hippocampi]CAH0528833.1 Aldose 1-epimerase [Vibrio hippocampi]